ncbi:hypothetical protein [Methanospirillum sp.]|uniref:hypothetical protein n=1 Tax=Methanospirillum sp. TaxID=45200 RepID=UPI0035A10105
MYSPLIWIIVSLIIIFAIAIIILSEYWNIEKNWIFGLISILVIYYIIMILPVIRGYYIFANGSSDIFAHLNWTQYVLNNGTINTVYPGFHILLAHFQLLTIIPIEKIALLIYPFFSILYILFLGILSKTIQRGRISNIPLLFAIPLLYGSLHLEIRPFTIAVFFIPLYYYFIIKLLHGRNKFSFQLLIIILSFCIVFLHQMITVILIILLLFFLLTNFVISQYEFRIPWWRCQLLNIIGILVISFSIWYLLFSGFLSTIKKLIEAFFQDTSISIIEHQTEILKVTGVDSLYVLKLFVLNYGTISLYLLFGIICTLFYIGSNIQKRRIIHVDFYFSIQYFIGIIISLLFLTGYFGIFEPLRALSPAILVATIAIIIIIPNFIYELSLKIGRRNILSIFFVILTIIILLQLFTIYDSPVRSVPSKHFSYSEKNGVDWLIQFKENYIPVLLFSNSLSYRKYELFDQEQHFSRTHTTQTIEYFRNIIPSHFGFDTHTTLSKSIDINDYYFIATERSRLNHYAVPDHRREQLPKITHADFERLHQDNSINLLYKNCEFEVWSSSIFHNLTS